MRQSKPGQCPINPLLTFPTRLPSKLQRILSMRVMVSLYQISAIHLAVALSAISVGNLPGQTVDNSLPRRGFFGASVAANDDGKVRIVSVSEKSTASDLGIQPGDIIRKLGRVSIHTPSEFVSTIRNHGAGDEIAIELVRDGERHEKTAKLKPYPLESIEHSQIEYSSVVTRGGIRLRTIVSVPINSTKPAPAVMFLPGGGCGSVEQSIHRRTARDSLLNSVARNGFATMRVERSGVGDSEGPPCNSIGYHDELKGYLSGLRALKLHPAIDSNQIFLLGGSLGGVFAPIVANEIDVAGIIVHGTIAHPPQPYAGRSERFFKEFAKVDVLSTWSAIGEPTLILHGEYDRHPNRSKKQHAKIAATINLVHPGAAIHLELEKHDHCGTKHKSYEDSQNNCGNGEITSEMSNVVVTFLHAQSKS